MSPSTLDIHKIGTQQLRSYLIIIVCKFVTEFYEKSKWHKSGKTLQKRLKKSLDVDEDSHDGQFKEPVIRKKRSCTYCPYKIRRMSKMLCFKCSKPVCGEHKKDVCFVCS